MLIYTINADSNDRGALYIGRTGENEARQINFDISSFIDEYGEGTCMLNGRLPGETVGYPISIEVQGNIATWNISDTDLSKSGYGAVDLVYQVGDVIRKSITFDTYISKAIDGSGSVDPYEDWLAQMQSVKADVEEIASDFEQTVIDATAELNGIVSDARTELNGIVTDAEADFSDTLDDYKSEAQGYVNIAKGYAEDAESSATEAQGYADSASQAVQTALEQGGLYPNIISGGLIDYDNYTSEKVPYLFRETPDISSKLIIDKIIGGTVAWNQLVLDANRNFTSSSADSRSLTLQLRMMASPYASAFVELNVPKGKFEKVFSGIDTQGSGIYFTHNGTQNNIEIFRNVNQQLYVSHKYLMTMNVVNNDTATVGGLVIQNIMLIDLTAMFGTTIADYIYSLEQATAGAGVAWFRRYFPEDYYPYSQPTLQSVQATAHKTYDGGGNVIGNYALDSSVTLQGLFQLDNGELKAYGDIYPPSGEIERKFGTLDLGSATWTYNSTYSCWVTSAIANTVKKYPTQAEMVNAIAENYVVDTVGILNGSNFTVGKFILGTSGNLFVKNGSDSATPTGAFVYELATPTTETATAYTNPQVVDPDGTEEYVTTGIVPVGHDTEYLTDIMKNIENIPQPPSANGTYTLTVTVTNGVASYRWA